MLGLIAAKYEDVENSVVFECLEKFIHPAKIDSIPSLSSAQIVKQLRVDTAEGFLEKRSIPTLGKAF